MRKSSVLLAVLGRAAPLRGLKLTGPDAERIIRLVAHVRREVHAAAPIISAEVPETGERFEGLLPPIVRAPTFAIRKRAAGVIPLDRYVADNILAAPQADMLRLAVCELGRAWPAPGGTCHGPCINQEVGSGAHHCPRCGEGQ